MLVIAVGSELRRDDGAAFAAVGQLRARLREETVAAGDRSRTAAIGVAECRDVLSLPGLWAGEAAVVVIDAVRSGAPPGTVHCLDATVAPLPAQWSFASSHQVGLAHVIEMARACGRLPRRLVVVGVEGEDFGFGPGLSAPVAEAIPRLLDAVLDIAQPDTTSPAPAEPCRRDPTSSVPCRRSGHPRRSCT